MIDLEKIEAALTTATTEQIHLFSSPESGEVLRTIATKYQILDREDYYTFSLLVAGLIFGISDRQTFIATLQTDLHLPNLQAAQLTAEVDVFLGKKSIDTKPTIENTQQKIPVSPQPVAPIRTMAQDMKQEKTTVDEPVYTSTQAAILNESKAGKDATWESDTN